MNHPGHSTSLFKTLADWELSLPEDYAEGSTRPRLTASVLRTLIVRRDDHPERPVAPDLARLARGPALLGWGEWTERDEFTRQEKRALVRAAWQSAHTTRKRLHEGWALAERGRHPSRGSWTSIPDLLWGLARDEITPDDIRHNTPPPGQWPTELQAFTAGDGRFIPRQARIRLGRRLLRELYPVTGELHAFRVLLMDATGYASEEVTGFGESEVEFLPKGVRLTLLKSRAGLLRHRAFRDRTAADTPTAEESDGRLTVNWPRREASEVVRQLLDVTARVRAKAPHVTQTLFVSAVVRNNFEPFFGQWLTDSPGGSFGEWLDTMGVEIKGDRHIGRLRKSVKVEKAIVTEGRVGAAADDHTEQTFAGHYAQGTTLRIMSGRTITTAQQHWFDQALARVDGPIVITPDVAEDIDQPQLRDAGLSADEAEAIMAGQLDMGVSHCRNPYESPFSPPGELCAVAPLRCLECRNAWILPSNLPQLLLFEDHLKRLRTRLAPQVFTRLWGQSWVNLRAVLTDRTDEENAAARKHIDAGDAVLDLPLTATTEFDA
ncbi:hypothetical protein OG883_42010 [Streptomyces sp. NBC_01142]|uniref:hypothetical protein n=1 Tax=Streptomyces sp. NBC_01142 TaxID=2975865 RepID=UPI0022503255|nr:hypothetical protein [Streptomyces sp. NBC_01142]MCX4826237.1 hypothetical protein [Streptomyces sp. NBC_01142]